MTMPATSARCQWVGVLAVTLLGLAVRLVPWGMTFTPEGVRFRSDSDPYYHALRAGRTLGHFPDVPWTDPAMNFPYGAEIPWPPLFDFAVAAGAKILGVHPGDPEGVARVAAIFVLLIGVALLPLVAVLGRRLLGGGLWVDAALVVALLPANVRFGAVGAADQHGAELLFCSGIFFAFVASFRGVRGGAPHRWRGPLLVGVLATAAFWNWLGSALYFLVLVAATALWRMLAPENDEAASAMTRTLAIGGALAAALLAVTIALFAPPGSLTSGGLNGLTGLHAGMCAVVGLFGHLLLLSDARWGRPPGWIARLLRVGIAGSLALLPLLLLPSLRAGIGRGLVALSRGNPWYDSIVEYQPVLHSGMRSLAGDLRAVTDTMGLGLFVMPLAAVALRKRWMRSADDRPALSFLFLWGLIFFLLTLKAARFQLYLVVPMALWICAGLRELAAQARSRFAPATGWTRPVVSLAGILAVCAPALGNTLSGDYARQDPGFEMDLIPAMIWLRDVPPTDGSRPAVMGEWAIGHMIEYFAAKPVIATPFGTEAREPHPADPAHPSAMEDAAAFFFSATPEAAEAVLARRRAGFVVLRSPKNELVSELGFAPPGTQPVADVAFDWLEGPTPRPREGFLRMVPSRLYYFDGMSAPAPGAGQAAALGGFRLLYESLYGESIPGFPRAQLYKVFGVVPGAPVALRGGTPGSIVIARTRVETNQHRVFEWSTWVRLDEFGRAALRLPYATGRNGLVTAGPYTLTDGTHQGTLTLDERDVAGATTEVDLSR